MYDTIISLLQAIGITFHADYSICSPIKRTFELFGYTTFVVFVDSGYKRCDLLGALKMVHDNFMSRFVIEPVRNSKERSNIKALAPFRSPRNALMSQSVSRVFQYVRHCTGSLFSHWV